MKQQIIDLLIDLRENPDNIFTHQKMKALGATDEVVTAYMEEKPGPEFTKFHDDLINKLQLIDRQECRDETVKYNAEAIAWFKSKGA